VTFGKAGTPRVLCHHGVLTAAVTIGKLLHCLHVQMKLQERSHLKKTEKLFLLPVPNIEIMLKRGSI
jgi:hypothetical protein